MNEKTYNVGIYCRLSNDDERDGESVSIENQKCCCRTMCVKWAGMNIELTVMMAIPERISIVLRSNSSLRTQKPNGSTSSW